MIAAANILTASAMLPLYELAPRGCQQRSGKACHNDDKCKRKRSDSRLMGRPGMNHLAKEMDCDTANRDEAEACETNEHSPIQSA